MLETTLQKVLEEKYNLYEHFYAEGRFVAVSDFNCNTAGLVGVGISKRNIVVAKVKLNEEDIDYELLSVTPVSLCRLEIQPRNSFTLRGPVNPSGHYLLCSSENMERVWNSFITVINAINGRPKKDFAGWKTVELQATESMYQNRNQNCPITRSGSDSGTVSFFDHHDEHRNHSYDKQIKYKNSAPYYIESVGSKIYHEGITFDNFVNDADVLHDDVVQECCMFSRNKEKNDKHRSKTVVGALYDFFFRS